MTKAEIVRRVCEKNMLSSIDASNIVEAAFEKRRPEHQSANPEEQGVYVIPLSEEPKLDRLYEKYGISATEIQDDTAEISSDSVVL